MSYRIVTSHLIGGVTWGYLPDESAEYASRQEAIDAAIAQADELVMEHHDYSAQICDEEDGVMTVVWEDEYPRGRRFEVVEHA